MNRGFGKPETRDSAIALLLKSYRAFWTLIQKRIDQLDPNDRDRQRFRALLGTAPMDGQLRLSDLVARVEFAKYVIDEVHHLSQISEDLDFYHLTLLADEGQMSDREPFFSLRLLKSKANRAMRKAGSMGSTWLRCSRLSIGPSEARAGHSLPTCMCWGGNDTHLAPHRRMSDGHWATISSVAA